MENELTWFEGRAEEAHWSLDAPPHPICRRYCDFLVAAAHARPYGVLAAILFAVEASYLAGWSQLPASGPYAECIQRWSSPPFAAYVLALRGLAESNPHPEQQAAFDEVLRHERDFWRMTWEG
jgi:thiaminase/transcriptional activator TenA